MNLTERDGTSEGSLLPGPPGAAQHSTAPRLGRALEEGPLPTTSSLEQTQSSWVPPQRGATANRNPEMSGSLPLG